MKGFCLQLDLFDFFNFVDNSLGISRLPAEDLQEFDTVRDSIAIVSNLKAACRVGP